MPAQPVTPVVSRELPGHPGVPASIGPVGCPCCDRRTATVHHVPDPGAGEDEYTPTLICAGCGSVFELEATAYGAGLAAGVLAERARSETTGA